MILESSLPAPGTASVESADANRGPKDFRYCSKVYEHRRHRETEAVTLKLLLVLLQFYMVLLRYMMHRAC